MNKIMILAIIFLTGCTQYWVKAETNIQKTAEDLHSCRMQANQGGQKVYTAFELEAPCMTAKGYELSNTPPASSKP